MGRYQQYRKFDGKIYRYVQAHQTKRDCLSQAKDYLHEGLPYRIVPGKSVFGKHYRLYVRDKWAKKRRKV